MPQRGERVRKGDPAVAPARDWVPNNSNPAGECPTVGPTPRCSAVVSVREQRSCNLIRETRVEDRTARTPFQNPMNPTRPCLFLWIASAILTLASGATAQTPIASLPYKETGGRLVRPQRILNVYDVSPWLVSATAGLEGPASRRTSSGRARTALDGQGDFSTDLLAASIKRFVEPPLHGADDVVAVSRHHLAVVGQARQQRWIEAFLSKQIEKATQQLSLEIQVVSLPREMRVPAPDPTAPRTLLTPSSEPTILTPAYRERLARALREIEGIHPIAAPHILCRPNQHIELILQPRTAYVRDLEVITIEKAGQSFEVADPIVELAAIGLRVEGTVSELPNGSLALNLNLEHRRLLGTQIPTVETRVGTEGRSVEVQRPNSREIHLDAVEAIESGETLQFASEIGGRVVLAWIRASRTDAQSGPPASAPSGRRVRAPRPPEPTAPGTRRVGRSRK